MKALSNYMQFLLSNYILQTFYITSKRDDTLGRDGSRTAATSKMELFVIIVNGFQPLLGYPNDQLGYLEICFGARCVLFNVPSGDSSTHLAPHSLNDFNFSLLLCCYAYAIHLKNMSVR